MAKGDDRTLLLQAVAKEVAQRANMPVPNLGVRRLKGRVAAYTRIFYKNRIVVNELAVQFLNRTEQTVLLAHEMGHLRYMWFSRILVAKPVLALLAVILVGSAKILAGLPYLFLLLFWPLSSIIVSWKLPEPIADHFARSLYGEKLCRKTMKSMKRKLRRAWTDRMLKERKNHS